MSQTISFFLPTRTGSQRVLNKNTRPFAGFNGGIFELKLKQLILANHIDEVIISTNDKHCINIANQLVGHLPKFKIIERPNELCLDSTALTDLILYAGEICSSDHILWGHTTTPLVSGVDYDKGIEKYFHVLSLGQNDSLVSVYPLKNFLINSVDGCFLGSTQQNGSQWPRTQDLNIVFEVNHAMFIAPRATFLNEKNRIGKMPFYYEMSKLKSFDIDWEEDFLIAEALYEKFGHE
jgi:N-acylneuraminate cytidylyltransferase